MRRPFYDNETAADAIPQEARARGVPASFSSASRAASSNGFARKPSKPAAAEVSSALRRLAVSATIRRRRATPSACSKTALADRAVDGDLALHPLDDAAGDGEAEAGAAVTPAELGVALLEFLEQARHAVFGDARTGVVNRKREHAAAGLLDDHPDAAGLGELHRVAGEVDEDLAQPIPVADDARRHVRRDEGRDLDALALGFGSKELDHPLDDGTDVEGLGQEVDSAGLDLRKVEDLVDEREQRLPGGLHGADIGRLLGARRGVEEEPGHAEDAVQRRAELVADGREEARFRLARRLGLGAGLLQGALGSDAFGDVAAGAHELRRAVAAGDRGLDPGQPADAVRRPDRLVDDAGAVGADARGAALDHRRTLARADQRLAGGSHELGEALVGEGDASRPVALDNDVELGLDQAAVALLGFGKPPGAVLEALDLRLERRGVARQPPMAMPKAPRRNRCFLQRGERTETGPGRDRQARQIHPRSTLWKATGGSHGALKIGCGSRVSRVLPESLKFSRMGEGGAFAHAILPTLLCVVQH